MKLVIGEYLRTLKERDELDRLLPDLLVEMGYVIIARPQTGNRQFGVDLSARGRNPEKLHDELLLLVVKQGDIGRAEWNGGSQAVFQSITEIFNVFLRSHVEPEDSAKRVHIVVATNGELKQTVQAEWSGFTTEQQQKADIEFWGVDRLSELIEKHLLDEYVFHDEDRKDLRRALALSGDSDYNRSDLYRLYLRTLDLTSDGVLGDSPKTGRQFLKALRIVNLSAQTFASWSLDSGDARQGFRAMERALLWSWHRIQLADEALRTEAIADAFSSMWLGYLNTARRYFERLQEHCHTEDGLSCYSLEGCELSLIAFEQIGILSTIGLSQLLFKSNDKLINDTHFDNATIVSDALASLVKNNGICSTPCLDRHSQDIALAMMLFVFTNKIREAKDWLRTLVRNTDYAFKAKRYVPISTDSIDDLVDEGGWNGGSTAERLMNMSWMLATLAGWCAILRLDEGYDVLARGAKEAYGDVCIQLWHPDSDIYKHLYFQPAHFESGASEAPIVLPDNIAEWRNHIDIIVKSDQAQIASSSKATQAGLRGFDLIASRHFSTPIAPYFWFRLADMVKLEAN